MCAYVIKNNGSSNNLPCYPLDSHQSHNAVYWSVMTVQQNLVKDLTRAC